jgi:hypothetical protein
MGTQLTDLTASPSDVSARPGNGVFDWTLFGRVLMHRRLELEYPPIEDNVPQRLAIERMVARELYPRG